MNILMNNFIYIAGGLHVSRTRGLGKYRLRPPTPANKMGEFINTYASAASDIFHAIKKRRKRNLPCRLTAFPKTHRTHPQPDDTPRTRMSRRLFVLLFLSGDG